MVATEASNAVLEASKNKGISREADEAIGMMLNLVGSNIHVRDEAALIRSAFQVAVDHELTTYDSVYWRSRRSFMAT